MARRSPASLAAASMAGLLVLLVVAGSPWLDPSRGVVAHATQLHRSSTSTPRTVDRGLAGAPRGGAARGSVTQRPAARTPQPPERFVRHLLVRVPRDLVVRAHPRSDSARIGVVPDGSKYYGVPTTAWVIDITDDGRWGLVEIPYVWPRREGWIRLGGLARSRTSIEVRVDLSKHWIAVYRRDELLFGMPAATGTRVSPTPPGRYFVSDRIPFSAGGYLGSFAFGISGIQPHLPPGWSGGNQLAIHGTNSPSSIGTSASAGCLRVSERALSRLLPLLRLGTPVIVSR